MRDLEEAEKRAGLYVIQNKDSHMVLGIGEVRERDESALCIFKTAMDAEEYIVNWKFGLDEWEAFGSDEKKDGLELLQGASSDYTHIAINPPLLANKPFMIMSLKPFIENFKYYMELEDNS